MSFISLYVDMITQVLLADGSPSSFRLLIYEYGYYPT
jgi:hypothetical protein